MFGFEVRLSRLVCEYSLGIKEGDVVEIRGEAVG